MNQKMNENMNLADKLLKKNHIRFEEESDSSSSDSDPEDDLLITEKNNNHKEEEEKLENKEKYEIKNLTFNLVKNRSKKEKSFGFQLKGESSKNGEHYIDLIEPNTPSERVGLKKLDKILKVNGISVEKLNINNLFDLLEYETSLNDFKLNLVVRRKCIIKENTEVDLNTSKRSLVSEPNDLEDQMGKKKQKNLHNDQTHLPDLGSFIPALQLEQSYNLSEITNQIDNEPLFTPTRTLEQIRNDKIEQIKFHSAHRPLKRSNVPSKLILNVKAKEIQKLLSEQGKYVNWQEIIHELLELYGCEHLGELGLGQADHLETISDLIRLQRRIDTFVISFESKVPFMTILDLEQMICNDYNHNLFKFNPNTKQAKLTRFEELYVGPLIKNQIIRQVFNVPDDVTTLRQLKAIRGSELIKHLISYLQDNELWSKKIKQTDFEAFLIEKLKVDSVNMLAVKIMNIGMLIGSLKTVQHLYSDSMREIKQNVDTEFKIVFQNEKTWLFKKLNEKLLMYQTRQDSDDNSTQLQIKSSLSYLKSNSIDIVGDLLGLFEKLLDKGEYYYMNDFLTLLKESQYLRDCFQLAICLGKHDLNVCLKQIEAGLSDDENEFYVKYKSLLKRLFFLIIDTKSKSNREVKRFLNKYLRDRNLKIVNLTYKQFDEDDTKNGVDDFSYNYDEEEYVNNDSILIDDKEPSHQSSIDYDARLADFINSKIEQNSRLTYEHLIKIENSIYEDLSCKFMQLLHRNKYLFEKNGLEIRLTDQKDQIQNNNELNQAKKVSFLNHIKQLKSNLQHKIQDETELLNKLEHLLSSYYSISSVKAYGFGDLKSLINQLEQLSANSPIVYQDTVLSHDMNQAACEESLDEVIEKLNKCPLLENVYDYLHWSNSGYSNLYGDLKQFLIDLNNKQANFNKIDLLELEPYSNKLLKLTNSTSIEQLKMSIETGDPINASGHLVSLICLKYKSLAQSPRSLLVNEIQSSLSVFFSKCFHNEQKNSEYFDQLYTRISKKNEILQRRFLTFIINLIHRIPFKLLTQLLFSYILDPLVKLNSDHQIKENIFSVLVINSFLEDEFFINENKKIKFFIKLGESCSINEWSQSSLESILTKLKISPQTTFKYEPTITNSMSSMIVNSAAQTELKLCEIKAEDSNLFIPLNPIVSQIEDSEGQYEHIQSIRKRYGIGLELNEQTKSVTESLKGVIGRSLESLSNELYNKDMHFVLELIQNADDNSYPILVDQEPTLVFLIEADRITLFNNELGFTDRNINAICDVKASTKGKHQRGYIGRKGIGFKSVFTVTDRPEIHSNGYHVNFDLSNGHIGYILPNWITDTNNLIETENLKCLINQKIKNVCSVGNLSTCIKLPLKSESEMQRHKSSLLTNNFNDIKPYLMLFLNRLRNLVIINNKNNSTLTFRRQDLDENLVVIKSDQSENDENKAQKWFVVRESCHVPDNLKPNDDVESTDLCFAFPIIDLSETHMEKMDVFAYLPLRSFGFKFIIQADFVVPASRQDVNQDSDWNQWIAKQIPNLFIKSLEYFKQHSIFAHSTSQTYNFTALKSYLKFIPLEEEIIGFFQHVPRQICELLRNQEFLPAVDCTVSDEHTIVWKRPFECVVVKDNDLIRQVLTSDMLKKYLGRYYLHEGLLDANINMKLLTSLGVHLLDINDILDVLKTVFSTSDSMSMNLNSVKTTAKWLVVLQHCLTGSYSLQQEDKFVNQLKKLAFIPVLRYDYGKNEFQNEMVSLDKVSVFFSFDISSKEKSDAASKKIEKISSLIEKDLVLLDSKSLLCLDDLKNAQIVAFLRNLGVKQIEPFEVIENHIIPTFNDASLIESKPEDVRVNYLIYINEFYASMQFNLAKLKETVLIKTNKGFQLIDDQDIYLSPIYGNENDLRTMLPSYQWTIIDPIYFNKSADLREESRKKNNYSLKNDQLLANWRKFLTELGLNIMFSPKSKIEKFNFESDYSSHLNHIPKTMNDNESLVICDYECQVFNFYMNLIDEERSEHKQPSNDLVKELTSLYRLIEDHWGNNTNLFFSKGLSSFKYASVFAISNEDLNCISDIKLNRIVKENLCESKYYLSLKTKHWICAETNKYVLNNSKIEPKTRIRLKEPRNVFVKEQVFLRVYGLNTCYALNTPLKEKSSFGRDLDFKFEFNFGEFLDVFKSWYGSENKKKCFASLSQMKNIYLLIASQLNSFDTKQDVYEKLKDIVLNHPIIFIPDNLDHESTSSDKPRQGSFHHSSQVFWCDRTGLFEKYKSTNLETKPLLLEPFYSESSKSEQLKQTFLTDFKVSSSPSLNNYIELLTHIALLASTLKTPFTHEQTIQDVYKLYDIIVDKCEELSSNSSDQNIKENVRWLLKDKEVIPCYKNKWLSLENKNCPILVDNEFDLAEKFVDKLNIVVVNSSSSNEFTDLCRADSLGEKISHFFYNFLEISSFSSLVILDLQNITKNLREAPQVQNQCRKLLPFIQSFLFYRPEFSSVYTELISDSVQIQQKLASMKFYSVLDLENVYRFRHDSSIYATVSSKTCVDTAQNSTYWKYFVRADVIDNLKDLIKGFVKLFTRNQSSEKHEKELINFCLLMHQFVDFKLNEDDRREIEKDFNLKLTLPLDVIKWQIKEANLGALSQPSNELEEGELEPSRIKFFEKTRETSEVKLDSKRQKLIAYDQLSLNQINLPDSSTIKVSDQNEFTVPIRSVESLDRNLKQLSAKMAASFSVESFQNSTIYSKEREFTSYSNEWSNSTINELNTIRQMIPTNEMNEASKDFIGKIGKWGELWVNEMLKKKFKKELKNNEIKIEWMNETIESGLPYDFKIIKLTQDDLDERVSYIEVKSTTRMSQESFAVSYQELLFAQEHSSQFEIYRLYNVITQDPNNVKLKIIKNIPYLLYSHGINLFILI